MLLADGTLPILTYSLTYSLTHSPTYTPLPPSLPFPPSRTPYLQTSLPMSAYMSTTGRSPLIDRDSPCWIVVFIAPDRAPLTAMFW